MDLLRNLYMIFSLLSFYLIRHCTHSRTFHLRFVLSLHDFLLKVLLFPYLTRNLFSYRSIQFMARAVPSILFYSYQPILSVLLLHNLLLVDFTFIINTRLFQLCYHLFVMNQYTKTYFNGCSLHIINTRIKSFIQIFLVLQDSNHYLQ